MRPSVNSSISTNQPILAALSFKIVFLFKKDKKYPTTQQEFYISPDVTHSDLENTQPYN